MISYNSLVLPFFFFFEPALVGHGNMFSLLLIGRNRWLAGCIGLWDAWYIMAHNALLIHPNLVLPFFFFLLVLGLASRMESGCWGGREDTRVFWKGGFIISSRYMPGFALGPCNYLLILVIIPESSNLIREQHACPWQLARARLRKFRYYFVEPPPQARNRACKGYPHSVSEDSVV
ncbi:hypothetical protein VTG60DRAFT_4942 [Thermothelomyces hinnuleus]